MEPPPIGIIPRSIFEEKIHNERVSSLLAAMQRFSKFGSVIPVEWINELADRLGIQLE